MQDFPNLPKSWQVKTLGEVCDIYTGNSINKEKKEKEFMDLKEGLNYIGTKDIGFDRTINYENGVKIPLDKLKDFRVAKANVSLLCIEGGSAGRKIGFTNQKVCFVNKLCCFEPFEDESKFVYFYLQSSYFLQKFNLNMSGLIGGISKEKIKQIKIPIPPLEIQKRIVKRLDEAFLRIENGTKHLKSAKDNLTKYKQSLLKSAFNGTLTQDCSLSLGKSTAESSLRENPQGFSWQSTHSLSQGESANLPQGWTIKSLGEVCDIISKGATPKIQNKTADKNSAIFLKAENVTKNGCVNFDNVKFIDYNTHTTTLKRSMLKNLDILITIAGSLAHCAVLEIKPNQQININQAVSFARLKDTSKVNPYFVKYFIMNPTMQLYLLSKAKTTAVPNLTLEIIRDTKIPIPPLETQKQIVAILEKHFTSADKVSAYIESCLSKAKQLKSSLLKSAFAGELT